MEQMHFVKGYVSGNNIYQKRGRLSLFTLSKFNNRRKESVRWKVLHTVNIKLIIYYYYCKNVSSNQNIKIIICLVASF